MTSAAVPLNLHVIDTGEPLSVSPERLIVAGYTARDQAAVARHIAELAAIGVPPPATVPAFYDLDPGLLTTETVVEVGGPSTSGEVEPVLIRHGGRYFLAVGSDHTDRQREREDIAASKAACAKPLGEWVAALGSEPTAEDWDGLIAYSTVDGVPYQRGSLSTLRHPRDLLERMNAALGDADGDLVLFCGTLPLLGGEFLHGRGWRIHLELPGGTVLTHAYETKRRNV
ncbi:hypothetical protein QFZ82_008009 [Streptomyces sp. V4I23]|uniref:DUF2848 family protein n=1 Tax=Streptomyces sp. V4I23 TaxID=3042282 RepID=UPI00278ADB00|nr:DUF2848 family protein [Streptomyces sp. V4I23]MDQ1013441.1 hypothetical protein [Streptomyces sp. V4I23]